MPFLAGVKVQRAAVLFPADGREKETRPPPFCLPPGLTPAGPARDTGPARPPLASGSEVSGRGIRLPGSRARPRGSGRRFWVWRLREHVLLRCVPQNEKSLFALFS